MNNKYNALFKPVDFKSGETLKNRIVLAPMTNFSSHPDGTVSDEEVNYYIRRSKGAGMVVTACTYVTANGKGFPGEFGADNDDMIPSLKKLATALKEQGTKAVLQIFHGGRSCPPDLVPNGDIVSASAIAAEDEAGGLGPTPRELKIDEVDSIIKAFGEATRRAIEAGFDGVEIHGANGYLLQQFFSPHSNRREDRFGGSLEKRMTFPMAIIDEVNRVVSEHTDAPFIVGYRFSPEEPTTPGITMADTLEFVDALSNKPLDYLHISLQEFDSAPRRGADDKRTRLELVLDKINNRVPLIGVGSIQTADDALKALDTGVPLIALGRQLIIDPDWVEKIQNGKENEIETELDLNGQERLVVPDPLWNAIVNTPGWFPGVK